MTKMANICGKSPLKVFHKTSGPIVTTLDMSDWGLKPIVVCLNDNHGLTLTYFMIGSNFAS